MGFIFIRVFAWLAALPYAIVALLVLTGGPRWTSVAYVLALGLLLAGLMTLPFPGEPFRRRRGLSRVGAGALVGVVLLRMLTLGQGRTMHVTDGEGTRARLTSRLVDESDVSINAARLLFGVGMLRDDAREVAPAMRAVYARMRRDQGDAPTPVVATHLGMQRSTGFDLVVIEGSNPARGAVVFLHGSAGNFELPCWQIARAVGSLGVTTACPSTRWIGDWDSEDGEATLRQTLAVLRARGIERFVLIGLSAGAYGASTLAPRMKGDFEGLVLLAGAHPDAPAAGVPALVVQGRHDTMVTPADSIAYAENNDARYVDVDAGHFALLVRSEVVEPVIREFVAARLP
jgi:pimeloyl-ACP methyl ester carboxylesterase